MAFCPTGGKPGPGRPPRRKTSEDFELPEFRPPSPVPEPDAAYKLLSEFAGRHVDVEDPAEVLALVWGLSAGFARWNDPEADHEWRQVMRRVSLAVENGQPACLRAAVVAAVKSLDAGFPTKAEQHRREARARRRQRRGETE